MTKQTDPVPPNHIRVVTEYALCGTRVAVKEDTEYRYLDISCIEELLELLGTNTVTISAVEGFEWLGARYVVR